MDQLRPVEQPLDLLGRAAVRDVRVLEDLVERPAALVLADHVLREPLLDSASGTAGTRTLPPECSLRPTGRLYSRGVKAQAGRGASHRGSSKGGTTSGALERVLIWIERRPGAVWAVGRIVDPSTARRDEPREDDYLWQGFELEDCLEAANLALEDEVVVSEEDGGDENARPFRREELLEPLERYFFGR